MAKMFTDNQKIFLWLKLRAMHFGYSPRNDQIRSEDSLRID